MKRMTLLAKRPDLSTSDFRQYWAGPHGSLALEMNGISRYKQNRVEKILWTRNGVTSFTVDGIVELWFEGNDAMRQAQASNIGSIHIPTDELNFLKGWTLCIVEEQDTSDIGLQVKVISPFVSDTTCNREKFELKVSEAVQSISNTGDASVSFNWTTSHARREKLWCEPIAPTGFAIFRFRNLKDAHDAFAPDGAVAISLMESVVEATAYLVNELQMR